ncbi:hypothetical protein GYMLUDRAFT_73163 [Collybiopsis luxurians FD-317 M1]|uniref:Uncharacterized protein n=1 Tax=Collybiopsis luxurians FD-317 M1 TaxID=944289 RepID=A0A0D0BD91_9AGAR|nr:hypothetical protein GYMLUDRAFT_73163 [Collybiopsis luxurians FD-317 M1]
MKSITFPKFMSLLWFLSKYPPHPGRLAAMSTLIDLAAGKSYLARNDVRELGDFLTALCRSYLVPPPGGMFPDVFFVDFPDEGEQERRRLFDHIREETRRLQTTVYQWRTKKM